MRLTKQFFCIFLLMLLSVCRAQANVPTLQALIEKPCLRALISDLQYHAQTKNFVEQVKALDASRLTIENRKWLFRLMMQYQILQSDK
jgi:hypothetical protein